MEMDVPHTNRRAVPGSPGVVVAIALAVLWVVLGVARPGITYHLAPLLVAAVPSFPAGEAHTAMPAVARGLLGLALSGSASVALVWLGALNGPALDPFTSATQESLVLAVVGAVSGFVVALLTAHR